VIRTTGPIKYGDGYKYVLRAPWSCNTGIEEETASLAPWLSLDQHGVLKIEAGYAWDGASGPTIDSPSVIRASLAHDALYQLMRAGKLPQSARKAADDLFYQLLLDDGMWFIRAKLWVFAVRRFAASSAAMRGDKTKTAP
jgi:hypothetical protein